MAGGKETPRQKMIGMMYLVLTALLALNVSKEIINAFVTQDDQLLTTNNNLVRGVNGMLNKFSMYKLNPSTEKMYNKWEGKVEKIKRLTNNIDDYLLENKNLLLKESEQISGWFSKNPTNQLTTWRPLHTIQNKSDYDIATRLFGGEKSSTGYKKGSEIRQKLLDLRDQLVVEMGTFSERGKSYQVTQEQIKNKETLEEALEKMQHPEKEKLLTIYATLSQPKTLLNHGEQQDWQLVKFDHQPVVGAIGVFTELRNQVRMAEQKALELIFSKLDGQVMSINKIEPQIIADSRYMNVGDTLAVKVGIVAYDSNATYPIKYVINNEEKTSPVSNFTVKGNRAGEHSVSGFLSVNMADGTKDLPWSFNYTVGKPQGTISLPEYDVIYGGGYENIIEGVASGYDPNQVSVKCDGCNSFIKSGGKYIAKANPGKNVTVKVMAPGLNYSKKFKVLNLPKPELSVMGQNKSITVSQIGNATQLRLSMPESSPLKLKYDVISFKADVNGYTKSCNGKTFNNAVKNLLKGVKSGDRITFYGISYKTPNKSSVYYLDRSLTLEVR